MLSSGMGLGRINASFADRDELQRVRQLYHHVSPLLPLMVDTIGFKIRLFKTNPEVSLAKGDIAYFSSHPTKDTVLGLDYSNFEQDTHIGERILIDDGLAQLKIVGKASQDADGFVGVKAKALAPCTIKKGKTLALPDTKLSFTDPISEKDRTNIQNALDLGYDFLNISFVRGIQDIRAIKQFIGSAKISLVAKIENLEGIHSIDEIMPYIDALMIPRGDLAVETPFESLPVIQKEMSVKAAQYGKPVIYASQILNSMKNSRFPLRAEISDLGNAVFDRADAIMLAQETAIGAYPARTVEVANKIIERTEASFSLDPLFKDDFILDVIGTMAKNPKTKEIVEKVIQVDYQLANGYKFNSPFGVDAYKTMGEFWYEFEPLVYLSKLRKPLSLSFESPDARALRQVGLLYGVTVKRV